MNAKRITTTLLVMAVVSLLVMFAFRIRVAATADSVALLKTSGMSCSSCSRKISSALEMLKGVAVSEVDLEGGWVMVGYDHRFVKPELLAEQVKAAGFGSTVKQVVTPEQYKQITGRTIGQKGVPRQGCCGGQGAGCGSKKQS